MLEERNNIQRYSKTFKLFKIQDLPGNIFYHTNDELKHPEFTNDELRRPEFNTKWHSHKTPP